MAYSCYVWTPLVSMTATKYQRHGYVERRPFLPGERLSAAREMERALPGYRALAADLQNSRRERAEQRKQRCRTERPVQASFYKSPVGTRTCRGGGATFHSEYRGRDCHFSATRNVSISFSD